MFIPDIDLDYPPLDDETTWRTWWTSRVTAIQVYASAHVWVRVRVPTDISEDDSITIPANGIVDLVFVDEQAVPMDMVAGYRNFWTFPAYPVIGGNWIYARVRDPSRASSQLVLLGPAELHEPYLDRYMTRNFLSSTVNGAEWVAHGSAVPPGTGWSDQQPDPRNVRGNIAVSTRYVVSESSGPQQAVWIRDVPGIRRIVVRIDDELYYDSGSAATVPEARNPDGDLAILLPSATESYAITLTRVFRDSDNLEGAFEQLIFPLRSVAYAPASMLFRVFTENTESVLIARGFEYARNILLLITSAVGVFAALIRRGAGFKSFLMFSLVSFFTFLALNSTAIWNPLYRLLSPIPGPPKLVPYLAVLYLPYVLIQFVKVSVDVSSDLPVRILTGITLGLGIAYSSVYFFFLSRGQFHLAENVTEFVAPVFAVAGAAVVIQARKSKERGILLSFAAFAVVGIIIAVWASIFGGSSGFVDEAVTMILVGGMLISLTGVPMTVYAAAERSILQTNRVFRRFVPGEFLAFLGINEIEQIEVGHQVEAELTLMFCDIRSFTTLSEKLNPAEVMELINRYLERVGPIIRENNGFVDKYMGDGIMAVFPGTTAEACRAALKIAEEMTNVDIGYELTLGLGLHRGPAMLGTIGERDRIDTTVLSDAVNVASRLQSMSAELNATVLVSSTVRTGAAAEPDLEFEYVDDVKVKGRKEAVETYRLTSALPG